MAAQQSRDVRRTVFIGLGGTGNEIVRRVKKEMRTHGYKLPLFQYFVLDTVAFNEKPGTDDDMRLMNGEEYLYIGGYNPNEVLKNIDNWPVIRRWWGAHNQTSLVTVDEGAGQMRSVGRMGFFYHFNSIEKQLRRITRAITSASNREEARMNGYAVKDNGPIIYLVFSLCGGTGSSLFFDVAYVMRQLLSFTEKPTVVAVAMLPGPYTTAISSVPQQERIQANAYAALMELERLHNMALGVEPRPDHKNLWNVPYATNFRVDSPELPFDYIYLIDNITTMRGESYELQHIYDIVSRSIFWLSGPSTAETFWERAKNLDSKTLSSGGRPDAAGRKRFSIYSSLGSSTIMLDWRIERVQAELENLLIDHICSAPATQHYLPDFFSGEIHLIEEVSGEKTGVNQIPPANQFKPNGNFNDTAAIDEMLERYSSRYQGALNNLLHSPTWRHSKDQCRDTTIATIDQAIQRALCTRGPVATLQELEHTRGQLDKLLRGIKDLNLKAKQRVSELNEEYEQSFHILPSATIANRLLDATKTLLRTAYINKRLQRPSTPRDLQNRAEAGARQRYYWYQAMFNTLIYDDIVESIFKPLIAHVDAQKAGLDGIEKRLQAMLTKNKELLRDQSNPIRDQIRIDRIRPALSETAQISKAIQEGKLQTHETAREILQQAFRDWPKPGGDAMSEMRPIITATVTQLLNEIGGGEHLVERLLRDDVREKRTLFLQGAECLWNFAKDTDQEILSHLESIDLFGFGIDQQHQDIAKREVEELADKLFKNQTPHPNYVSTEINSEIVLLKTSHGLPISSIRAMPSLQHSYRIMDVVRGAPYLHIDYADQIRRGYAPLAIIQQTYKTLIDNWQETAANLDNVRGTQADQIRQSVERYQQTISTSIDEFIEIERRDDPFFELLYALRFIIMSLNQTPAIAEARMQIADMEDILHSQGWIKINPAVPTRFDPDLHTIHQTIPQQGLAPGRIVAVIEHGYSPRSGPPRKARVDVS